MKVVRPVPPSVVAYSYASASGYLVGQATATKEAVSVVSDVEGYVAMSNGTHCGLYHELNCMVYVLGREHKSLLTELLYLRLGSPFVHHIVGMPDNWETSCITHWVLPDTEVDSVSAAMSELLKSGTQPCEETDTPSTVWHMDDFVLSRYQDGTNVVVRFNRTKQNGSI